MASLLNQPINTSYPALIKTEDNAPITTVPKLLTDGDGNLLPVSVSTLGMEYTGIQDFTGATVLGGGLPTIGGLVDTGQIIYSTPYTVLASTAVVGTSLPANTISFAPILGQPGQTFTNMYFKTFNTGATGTFKLAVYNAVVSTDPAVGAGSVPVLVPGSFVEFASYTNQSPASFHLSGINYTLPATEGGLYFIAMVQSTTQALLGQWQQATYVGPSLITTNAAGTSFVGGGKLQVLGASNPTYAFISNPTYATGLRGVLINAAFGYLIS